MPRDSNGLYTLPAGNPVISGSVITPTWANPTMNDLGDEMSDSLSRSGQGGMLVPFEFTDGDQSNPGMSWTAEPSTGFYRAGTLDMRATVGAQDVAQFVFGESRLLHDGALRFQTQGFGTRVVKEDGNLVLLSTTNDNPAFIDSIFSNDLGSIAWRLLDTGNAQIAQYAPNSTAFEKTWATLVRDGRFGLNFDGVEVFRTSPFNVQNARAEILNDKGQFKPIGYNSLPTTAGGDPSDFTLDTTKQGERIRPNSTSTMTVVPESLGEDGAVVVTVMTTGTFTVLASGGVTFTLIKSGGNDSGVTTFDLVQGDTVTITRLQESDTYEVWGTGL